MATLKQAHGNWVCGKDRFWNRDAEVALFIRYLDEGASMYLVAQRRIGKTSLMREVSRRIDQRYICLHIDLQDAGSAPDFVAALGAATYPHKSLWAKTKTVFGNVAALAGNVIESLQIQEIQLTIREGLLQGNWETKGAQLLEALAASGQPVVIFMDEVPVMVNRILKGPEHELSEMTQECIAATDAFMSWMRAQSIRHNGKVRFVLTGSIGFEPILRQAGLSATINNFRAFHLDPWSPETAIGCLQALANCYGVDFQEGARERVVERLGSCIPHHVQMYFGHIHEMCMKRGNRTCFAEDVDRVYEERMLSTRGHAELSTFEERLKMMVGRATLPFVLDLLTEAAVVGQLTPSAIAVIQQEYGLAGRDAADQTREVLEILEHDGYLKRGSGGFAFESKLLRDWWHRRFAAFGYTPALQRGA
ncbi:MAG TPA: hypothetical protein VHG28_17390 [Longimicrobiaceae bacterium]|nr:hypothetical protein [Longimicrobiaceae bacterium]